MSGRAGATVTRADGGLEPVVLAVDAGTGSVRVLAFTLGGELVTRAAREWVHPPVPGFPGGTEFRTGEGWELLAAAFRDVTEKIAGREIVAVAASSMREGFVLYDGAGQEIWACPNTDGRARTQADALTAAGVADRVYQVGGDWISITAPSRLRWLAEHAPEVLGRARHLGMLSDWVAYRLTGEFTTEPTCGSSSALFDLAKREWSPELAELVGIDPGILPPVVAGGTVIGRVSSEAARDTGLPAGVPVAAGGADTQLALYGLGAGPSVPTVVAGTFWQVTALAEEAVVDPRRRLRTLCHVESGQWMVEGIGFLSGLAMRWFRDAFCADLVDRADVGGVSPYTLMEEYAAEIPAGSNGVVAVLSNAMQADAWHHAVPSFVGVDISDPDKTGRAAFIRAIEEAAAYVTRSHLEVLDELVPDDSGELTLTGGSSGGWLWPQIVADVTGRRVRRSELVEATSYGAARLAASAAGAELPPVHTADIGLAPDPVVRDVYTGLHQDWRRTYDAMVAMTRHSGLAPLFTPPGGLPYQEPG